MGQLEATCDVIVAGAGHNGLVAACYLAKAGLKVLVLEAHNTVGGMTSTNPMAPEAPDHMINEASIHASLFRMSPIDRELELTQRFGLKQRVIDPCHVQLAADGDASLAMWNDASKTAEEIKHFSKRDAQAWIELSNTIDAAMKMGLPLALTSAASPSVGALWRAFCRSLPRLHHIKPIVSLVTNSHAGALEEMFESDIVRASLLTGLPFMDFQADTSAFCLIYLAALQSTGISMFEGGTGALPASLVRCLTTYGGEVRTNAKVDSFLMTNGAVAGVRLVSGEEILAPKGVLTAYSPKAVLNHTLPKGVLSEMMQKRAARIPTTERGIADYKLNIALKGKVHPRRFERWRENRNIGIDLRLPTLQWATYSDGIKAYEACKRRQVPDVIAGLSQITTAFDPAMAPPGHDTFWFWSGLIPVNPEIGWDKARQEITDKVVRESSDIYEGIEELEIARRPLAPPDIEQRFHAIDGSVYHVEPFITRFGPGRPAPGLADYKTPVAGLFLSGSGTHPSAGICGIPGRNAAKKMIRSVK
ncbi:MAG: NAD(P)/FAD-dependent oxidoreductase [Parvibaculaceae bacterium]